MRFVKISDTGLELPPDATEWAAVLDKAANLMWSANDVGKGEIKHAAAEKAVAKLDLAGAKDWRLPTVEELFLLADRTKFCPAIDTDFFPSCQSDYYWSSSPDASAPADDAWIVHFNNGHSDDNHRGHTAFVRAVRSVVPASQ